MMIQMADKPNTTPIGQDRETLTFKALLHLNVAVNAQVCRLFCVVYIPLFSSVQLRYPAITNIFVVNQIIRFIIHQTHYEKSDWLRAFNQFTIACELDMINVLSAADNTFIMSSSTSSWLLSPLKCSQKQNG